MTVAALEENSFDPDDSPSDDDLSRFCLRSSARATNPTFFCSWPTGRTDNHERERTSDTGAVRREIFPMLIFLGESGPSLNTDIYSTAWRIIQVSMQFKSE